MLFQEVGELRQELNVVTSNLTVELDKMTHQRSKEIAELEVCSVCVIRVSVHCALWWWL